MAAKLSYETRYLSRWLPSQLSEDDTRALVIEAISDLHVEDPKEAGRVVGHIMKTRPGELDGALVNRLVRETLGG